MRISLRSARLPLGVDPGSHSLKVVRLQRRTSGFKVARVALARLDPLAERPEEEVPSLLQHLLERSGLRGEPISFVLPGRDTLVRFFSMPRMPAEELAQAVAWEAAKHVSLPPEDLVTDFVVYESAPGLAEGQQQVLAVMAPRAEVERWVETLERAGVRVAAVDIPSLALLGYCDVPDPWGSPGCIALLDLGHAKTGIHFFQDRRLCFTRDVAIGGQDVSRSLADVLCVDPAAADDLKGRFGLTGAGQDGDKVRQIVEQVLERIAVEVQRSFDYYQAQFREAAFRAVRLCGGTALLPGVDRYFTEALHLEARVDQPWQALAVDPAVEREAGMRELGPAFALGIGAATRELRA